MILRPFRILTFVKKKWLSPLFFILFKKMQLFVLRIYFLGSLRFPFTSFKKMQLYCPVILLPVILLLIICLVIWCFPIWLTSLLSYPMAIFSANEIRTFFNSELLAVFRSLTPFETTAVFVISFRTTTSPASLYTVIYYFSFTMV